MYNIYACVKAYDLSLHMCQSIYLSIYPGFSPRGVQPRASDHLQLCHQDGAKVKSVSTVGYSGISM